MKRREIVARTLRMVRTQILPVCERRIMEGEAEAERPLGGIFAASVVGTTLAELERDVNAEESQALELIEEHLGRDVQTSNLRNHLQVLMLGLEEIDQGYNAGNASSLLAVVRQMKGELDADR